MNILSKNNGQINIYYQTNSLAVFWQALRAIQNTRDK